MQTTNKQAENVSYMCRLAEQTERFDDMLNFVRQMIAKDHPVDDELTTCLSIAFKNVMGANRSTWRAVCNLELKEKDKVAKIHHRTRTSSKSSSGTEAKSQKS